MAEFGGFPEDFFVFLQELKDNNNRDWFNTNKNRYYESVVNPIGAFIVSIAPRLKKISRHYIADPKPHGGSMFRIYRDTRFSKDKSPYKTHAGVQFRHEAGKNAHAPGFYVHLADDELVFGGGIWQPPGPQLNRIREYIADNSRSWARIRNATKVKEVGGIKGDSLKRPPQGFDAQHVHIEDLKRKSFYVMTEASPEIALKPGFIDEVTEAFRRAAPLTRFITGALDLPF
ncbi:MAG: DUF2461 domain-containing protein [Xanthomonadales bacterium]|nr:DUF2461 domain-containing protein [Gammaproteobacteria bacterium]MBT8052700.1 DUF2461 domain-containing protein [Gammaproteobacteria bacterium]NND57362.1 DUF2461 domain-containing protein [Xanthomonadales bacterium]NNK50642.1 DUF2461 domain-containing protein [Xanthomonadales bacterium]